MPHRGRRTAATRVPCKAPPYAGGVLGSVCHKTRLCVFHVQGHCSRGSACVYAHGEHELKPMPDLTRTKICPHLSKEGRCNNSSSCPYAHSEEELRPVAASSDNKNLLRQLVPVHMKTPVSKPALVSGSTASALHGVSYGTSLPTATMQLPAAAFTPQAFHVPQWCPSPAPCGPVPGVWFAMPRAADVFTEECWSHRSTASTPSAAAGNGYASCLDLSAEESPSGAGSNAEESLSTTGSNHGDEDVTGPIAFSAPASIKFISQDSHYEIIIRNTFLHVRLHPGSAQQRVERRSASVP